MPCAAAVVALAVVVALAAGASVEAFVSVAAGCLHAARERVRAGRSRSDARMR
jgi:hypothetical protein